MPVNNKVQILIQDERGHTIQQTIDFGNGTSVASMVLEDAESEVDRAEKRQPEGEEFSFFSLSVVSIINKGTRSDFSKFWSLSPLSVLSELFSVLV